MRKILTTDLIIFLGILLIGLTFLLLNTGHSAIDIQLYDTYFVIEKSSMMLFIVESLTFLIFLIRAFLQKFKAIGSNIGLIIGLLFAIVITYYFLQVKESMLNQMEKLDGEGLHDRLKTIAEANKNIYWTWALMGFWLTSLLLLIRRAVKIWRKR